MPFPLSSNSDRQITRELSRMNRRLTGIEAELHRHNEIMLILAMIEARNNLGVQDQTLYARVIEIKKELDKEAAAEL